MGFESFINPFSKNPIVVGSYIGERFLRIALLKRGTSGLELDDFVIEDLSRIEESERDNFIKERLDAFAKDHYIFEGDACIVIGNDVSFSRRINMPSMPVSELKKALAWETRDTLPFPTDQAKIDFQIIKEQKDDQGVKSIDLIFMAAHRETINKYVTMLKDTTLTVENVNIITGSLSNIINYAKNIEQEFPLAVIDIGYRHTNICVFKEKDLIFTRTLLIGYGDIINSLLTAVSTDSGVAQFSYDDAKKIIDKHGIPSSEGTIDIADKKLDSERILSMMRPVLENLAKETKNSFLHLTERLAESPVTKIYLCGVGARMKNISNFFKNYLNTDTEVFPLDKVVSLSDNISKKKREELPELVSTVGVALSEVSTVNFLPFELRKKKREIIERIALRIGAIAIVAVFFLSYVFMNLRQINYAKRYESMQYHKDALVSLRESKDQIERMESVISAIKGGRLDAVLILKELSNITPKNILLEDIDYSEIGRNVKLSGTVNADSSLANTIITEYIKIIENSPVFETASLVSSSVDQAEGEAALLKFRLQCLVEIPALTVYE